MEVIPVLDVRQGTAVLATGGDRRRYRPVASVLTGGAEPLALAREFRKRLGVRCCYIADLVAIEGGPPDVSLVRALAQTGLELWVDAGIADATSAGRTLAAGASRAIVGLETLPALDALVRLSAAGWGERLVFSLDLRGTRPVTGVPELATRTPFELADAAIAAGCRTLLIIDLARVGNLAGPALEVIRLFRKRHPEVSLAIGGGVRGEGDLRRLAELGCAGALVGRAIHSGRIGRTEIEAVAAL